MKVTDEEFHLSTRYALLVSFVFAAIVGQSLNMYSNILFSPEASPSFLALIGLYLLLLFSWAGYHQSLTSHPYTQEKIAVVRLGADFLIVVVYAYLLQTVGTINAGETVEGYILGFDLVFVSYLLSGLLKRIEHNDEEASKAGWHTIMIILYTVLYFAYKTIISTFNTPRILDSGVIFLVIVLMLGWRFKRDIGGVINWGST